MRRLWILLIPAMLVACEEGTDPSVRELEGVWYFAWTTTDTTSGPEAGLVCEHAQVRATLHPPDGSYQGGTRECTLDGEIVSSGPAFESGAVTVTAFDEATGAVALRFADPERWRFTGVMDVNGTTMEGEADALTADGGDTPRLTGAGSWSAVRAVD